MKISETDTFSHIGSGIPDPFAFLLKLQGNSQEFASDNAPLPDIQVPAVYDYLSKEYFSDCPEFRIGSDLSPYG